MPSFTIREARVTETGTDGQHAPGFGILHKRNLAQALDHCIIMHRHRRWMLVVDGNGFCDPVRQVELRILSQLPGRFCPPRAIVPSAFMIPGQAMPMNGAK